MTHVQYLELPYNIIAGQYVSYPLQHAIDVVQTHDSDVRELIAAVDKQQTGYINYDSFEAVMARSLLQSAGPVDASNMSATIRLQPDTSALPFHEVLLLHRHTRSSFYFIMT